jgi:hypothetical protein
MCLCIRFLQSLIIISILFAIFQAPINTVVDFLFTDIISAPTADDVKSLRDQNNTGVVAAMTRRASAVVRRASAALVGMAAADPQTGGGGGRDGIVRRSSSFFLRPFVTDETVRTLPDDLLQSHAIITRSIGGTIYTHNCKIPVNDTPTKKHKKGRSSVPVDSASFVGIAEGVSRPRSSSLQKEGIRMKNRSPSPVGILSPSATTGLRNRARSLSGENYALRKDGDSGRNRAVSSASSGPETPAQDSSGQDSDRERADSMVSGSDDMAASDVGRNRSSTDAMLAMEAGEMPRRKSRQRSRSRSRAQSFTDSVDDLEAMSAALRRKFLVKFNAQRQLIPEDKRKAFDDSWG